MRITVEKAGKADCLHEYVYSPVVLLSYPAIETRICKHCGQVENVSEELSHEPTYDELYRKFHGDETRDDVYIHAYAAVMKKPC